MSQQSVFLLLKKLEISTSITAYREYNYPWFSLYDEHAPAVNAAGQFNDLKSMKALGLKRDSGSDEIHSELLLNPDAPPPCSIHQHSTAACVARPCGHFMCVTCVGQAVLGEMTCGVAICDKRIEATVGFKKPLARMTLRGGSTEDWWESEKLIEGVSVQEKYSSPTNVVSLILDEDEVSPLRGRRYR